MGLAKSYSLKSRTRIDQLIREGSRSKAYPIHLITRCFKAPDEQRALKVVITAPKRIFRKAVTRNRRKRLLKEAFRPFIPELEQFMEYNGITCDMMLIYVGKEDFSLIDISTKIKVLLDRWKEQAIPPTSDEHIQRTT